MAGSVGSGSTVSVDVASRGKKPSRLAHYLLARASEEDVAAYDPAMLDKAAELAADAVSRHRKGASVVAIDSDADICVGERPLTVVTVVNDNMPFLFDSVLGEITESAGEPTFVTHPVLLVAHGRNGVESILGEVGPAGSDREADRVSVIHVHVRALAAQRAAELEERLKN